MNFNFKKTVAITFLFIVAFSFTKAQQAHMVFRKESINLGTVALSDTVMLDFEFKNTGKLPLIVHKVETTCGCTLAKKPKKPVLPKEKGVILVRYVAEEEGRFSRTVTIYNNTKQSPLHLYLYGKVVIENGQR